jgi:hypothetical protein
MPLHLLILRFKLMNEGITLVMLTVHPRRIAQMTHLPHTFYTIRMVALLMSKQSLFCNNIMGLIRNALRFPLMRHQLKLLI